MDLTHPNYDLPLHKQLEELYLSTKEIINYMDEMRNKESNTLSRKKLQKLINTNPKLAHKDIFKDNNAQPRTGLRALRDPETNTIETEPTKQAQIVEKYFSDTMKAANIKRGKYLPEDAPRNYPWEQASRSSPIPDPFTLQSHITKDESQGFKQRKWLHPKILDNSAFTECIKTFRNDKSPGPDGIVNELLRMLPHEILEIIHKLFVIMWATRITPTSWKTSITILIDKNKRAETDVSSYRPIGLAITLYKLWTRLVTNTLYEYAEAHSLLSTTQAGFRNQKDTIHQLQNVIMSLEDAKLFKNDIYALIVDFTSAFNTTDHDRMLWIMYDLGFPTDAIDTVKRLYEDATTQVRLPSGGSSQKIPVERGTIQGDTLSPFLFLLYMEPPLRWLHVGGRGYRHACIRDQNATDTHLTNILSSAAFADDLLCPISTIQNLKIHARKLTLYSDWAALIISGSKTKATGILHNHPPKNENGLTSSQTLGHQLVQIIEVQQQKLKS